jgi:hypothetical protein
VEGASWWVRREERGFRELAAVKMSAVNVTNVTVLDNPSMFLNPFQFEISYECLVALKDGNGLFLLRSEFSWFVSFSIGEVSVGHF